MGNSEPTQSEIMELFPHLYEGYVAQPKEIDDELGLEIVVKETIEQKYGVPKLDPRNDFHNSLKKQYEQNGSLSRRQVDCLMNPKY